MGIGNRARGQGTGMGHGDCTGRTGGGDAVGTDTPWYPRGMSSILAMPICKKSSIGRWIRVKIDGRGCCSVMYPGRAACTAQRGTLRPCPTCCLAFWGPGMCLRRLSPSLSAPLHLLGCSRSTGSHVEVAARSRRGAAEERGAQGCTQRVPRAARPLCQGCPAPPGDGV